MAEHWIELVKSRNTLFDLGKWNANFSRHLLHVLLSVRKEFVKRRVQQTNGNWFAIHCLKDAFEVFTLVRKKLLDRFVTIGVRFSKDEAANIGDAIAFEDICSVRQRPMPSAPNAIAADESAGESALVRTPILRNLSDQSETVWYILKIQCFWAFLLPSTRAATTGEDSLGISPS